jgi:hypothetical protein
MSILLSWWGSFEDGGETIGDLWAACAVAKRLAASNCNFAIAGRTQYAELPLTVSAWENAVPEEVSTLIFVCGPVSAESIEFRAMIGHFSRSKKIAAGVSILPRSSSFYWNPFDIVLARDGCAPSYGDLAPAFTTELGQNPDLPSDKRCIGLCFRGEQAEYGIASSLHEKAHDLAHSLAAKTLIPVQILDTRLYNDQNRSSRIVSQFDECKFVISTRLHGVLLSLCRGIPALGIDQISGGGKLTSVLNQIQWPYVCSAEQATASALEPVIDQFAVHAKPLVNALATARRKLMYRSQLALKSLINHVLQIR